MAKYQCLTDYSPFWANPLYRDTCIGLNDDKPCPCALDICRRQHAEICFYYLQLEANKKTHLQTIAKFMVCENHSHGASEIAKSWMRDSTQQQIIPISNLPETNAIHGSRQSPRLAHYHSPPTFWKAIFNNEFASTACLARAYRASESSAMLSS
ncbi:hypothetical protein P170DRAFT_476824 [Aspergillus steynii IBT 23096]|uniref:Uncharacterized protein n=1 Tax=Aspergillus steynii IBT 23096 TaxID=1392250 RepID=A0A2I2G5M5_9EURO|nr:uncharacterized protein P170DRAFT_476824 [Aspergillus steynii IBT 23096]PLB48181.1 hypothetical protein P170DRAFT_476824 [Aspergillus steynii IBT 23096]